MTERERFEKVWPVPEGVFWSSYHDSYMQNGIDYYAKIYRARWETWQSKESDPWDMVPSGQINFEDEERNLIVYKSGEWQIWAQTSCQNNLLASGYNCDPSRNGETKTWNEERREWE